MPQISLLSGISSDANADFRTQYPVNLVPVPKDTGVSKGYLRFAPGLTRLGASTGPGADRGGINWAGSCYRVMGTSLMKVAADGALTNLGTIAGAGPVSMDYSPDHLCVVGGGNAYLYDGATLAQITDPDIGVPTDVVWIDGYFLFTDSSFLYVTDLGNPFSVDPLKYAASEIDPDNVIGVQKYRNEAYAFNRFTIEVFNDVGGTGFPFARIPGGLIPKGCVGTKMKALFTDTLAWVGSARNEPCSVYVASGGQALKIATREIEVRLAGYTEAQLASSVLEARADRMHQHLIVHLPNETLVYDAAASAVAGEPVWFYLSTGTAGPAPYRACGFVYCYGKWIVGDTQDGRVGYVDEAVVTQYGEICAWQFDTMILYNEGRGAMVNQLELVGTTGRAVLGEDPRIFYSFSDDGETWSDERTARVGTVGALQQRVIFRRCGRMRNMRALRFRGASSTPISWARLEADLEGLAA